MNKEKDMEEKKPRIGHLCKGWDSEFEPENKNRLAYSLFYYNEKMLSVHCRELTPDDLVLAEPKLPRPEIGTPVCIFKKTDKYFAIQTFGCYATSEIWNNEILTGFNFAKPIPSLTSMLVEDLINHPEFQEYEV